MSVPRPAKRRRVSPDNEDGYGASTQRPSPRPTPASMRPVIDPASGPHYAPNENIQFDANDPIPYIHATTPLKCKITNTLNNDHRSNKLEENERAYYIDMFAPLHLCSLKVCLVVDLAADEARSIRLMACSEHGQTLTKALQSLASPPDAPQMVDWTKFQRVINSYWEQLIRRAQYFVTCDRYFWNLLGRGQPPLLPTPPTLWKDGKKRKRNAIPLGERVMEAAEEDIWGNRPLFGRPDLLPKTNASEMTMKRDNVYLTVTWNIRMDEEGNARSKIKTLAGRELEDEPVIDPAVEEQESEEATPANGDANPNGETTPQEAEDAGNEIPTPAQKTKKKKEPEKKIAGFASGHRKTGESQNEVKGEEIPTTFRDLVMQHGILRATLEIVAQVFPPIEQTLQDRALIDLLRPTLPMPTNGQPRMQMPNMQPQGGMPGYELPSPSLEQQTRSRFLTTFDTSPMSSDPNNYQHAQQYPYSVPPRYGSNQYEQQVAAQLLSQMPASHQQPHRYQ